MPPYWVYFSAVVVHVGLRFRLCLGVSVTSPRKHSAVDISHDALVNNWNSTRINEDGIAVSLASSRMRNEIHYSRNSYYVASYVAT